MLAEPQLALGIGLKVVLTRCEDGEDVRGALSHSLQLSQDAQCLLRVPPAVGCQTEALRSDSLGTEAERGRGADSAPQGQGASLQPGSSADSGLELWLTFWHRGGVQDEALSRSMPREKVLKEEG